eukprot:SAG31_NODE_3832_length_3839_cov_7.354813_3_plen_51_part_00
MGFAQVLDAMGRGSAVAQRLFSPITTYDKLLQNCDQVRRTRQFANNKHAN